MFTQRAHLIPLLGAQKSIYYFEELHSTTDSSTAAYHYTLVCNLNGELNIPLFTQAMQRLMERHEALRVQLFKDEEGEVFLAPLISNNSSPACPLQIINAAMNPASSIEAQLKEIAARPFFKLYESNTIDKKETGEQKISDSPNEQPLWRCVLVQYPNQHYQLLIAASSLIVDVPSANILMHDLSEFYNALVEGREPSLPNLPALREIKPEASDLSKLEKWKATLNDLSPLQLRTDFMPQSNLSYRGNRIPFKLEKSLIDALTAVDIGTQNISLHLRLLASLYILLYRYTGQTDICLGTTSANRHHYSVDVSRLVFGLVNSIPIRAKFNDQFNYLDMLQLLKPIVVDAYQNQLPFDLIAEQALSKREKGRLNTASPFDIIFNLNEQLTPLTLKEIESSYPDRLNLECSRFKLGINIDKLPDGSYRGYFEYNPELFKASTIDRIKDHWLNILKSLAQNPQEKIANIYYLTAEDRAITTKANDTQVDHSEDPFVKDLLRQTAQQYPHRNAVVFHQANGETETLTYKDLLKKIDRLAALLRAWGVGPEKIVAICLNRSPRLTIARYAVLEAGGVVLHIENNARALAFSKLSQVEDRLEIIIVDNSTQDLFKNELSEKNKTSKYTLINLDKIQALTAQLSTGINYGPPLPLTKKNLAYIAFTSGSTGTPNGIMITQEGFANLAMAIGDRVIKDTSSSAAANPNRSLPQGCQVLAISTPEFDCSFWEEGEAWKTGGTLHIVHQAGRLDPEILQAIIIKFQINAVTLLPQIADALDWTLLTSIKDLIIMGAKPKEGITQRLKQLIAERNRSGNPLAVRHEFGTTEDTVCTTENPIHAETPFDSIGFPARNHQIHILDGNLQTCPIGVPGELYLAGLGLASGILGNPVATHAKFLPLEFNPATLCFRPSSVSNLACSPSHRAAELKYDPQEDMDIEKEEKQNKSKKHKSSQPRRKSKIQRKNKKARREENTTETNAESAMQEEKDDTSTTGLASDITRFSSSSNQFFPIKVYKTGDLGVREKDGSIRYIGRVNNDTQIKIDGTRFDLAEIKAAVERHPNIQEAHLAYEAQTEETGLVQVYVLLKNPAERLHQYELNNFLESQPLSSVARVHVLFIVTEVPLNANGKVDFNALKRKALPASPLAINPMNMNRPPIVKPTTELQIRLAEIWKKVLLREIESINDSFTSLGGNSLNFVIMQSLVNAQIPLKWKIKLTRNNLTIDVLANTLIPILRNSQNPLDFPRFFPAPTQAVSLSLSANLNQSSAASNSPTPSPHA